MKLLYVLILVPEVFGASFTYRVTDHLDACREVRLPKWTIPREMREAAYAMNSSPAIKSQSCPYDLHTPDGTKLYVAITCQGEERWPIPEKYEIDWSRPKNVQKIDDTVWQAAANSTNLVRRPSQMGRNPDDNVKSGDRFFKRAGPKWPFYGEGPYESASRTRIVVDSWDGDIAYPEPFGFGRPLVKGQYWTEIFDAQYGRRLLQIRGVFHGVEPYKFQQKAALFTEKFYMLPLQPKGMRRLLLCNLAAVRPQN